MILLKVQIKHKVQADFARKVNELLCEIYINCPPPLPRYFIAARYSAAFQPGYCSSKRASV